MSIPASVSKRAVSVVLVNPHHSSFVYRFLSKYNIYIKYRKALVRDGKSLAYESRLRDLGGAPADAVQEMEGVLRNRKVLTYIDYLCIMQI